MRPGEAGAGEVFGIVSKRELFEKEYEALQPGVGQSVSGESGVIAGFREEELHQQRFEDCSYRFYNLQPPILYEKNDPE